MSPQSVWLWKKWTDQSFWVAFGFMFIGNPEEKSLNPSFQLQQMMKQHQSNLADVNINRRSFSFPQRWRRFSSSQFTYSLFASLVLSVPPLRSWLHHPWLPQDDRLSYRESLSDSGVSRTWGRLGESASSGRSRSSSSPASRLISGTLGVRVFPLRLMPDWAGTGRLPGSTTRLEEGPPAFMLWEDAEIF